MYLNTTTSLGHFFESHADVILMSTQHPCFYFRRTKSFEYYIYLKYLDTITYYTTTYYTCPKNLKESILLPIDMPKILANSVDHDQMPHSAACFWLIMVPLLSEAETLTLNIYVFMGLRIKKCVFGHVWPGSASHSGSLIRAFTTNLRSYWTLLNISTEGKFLICSKTSILLTQSTFSPSIPIKQVAGSTPAEVGNILSWRLIMKYFLRSFSPFR